MGRPVWRALVGNASFLTGILIGVKFADYLLYDHKRYEVMKEEIEIDYWKKYGRPTEIKPELHKSSKKEGEFYVTYLKEKQPHKYMEERYKLH